MADTEAVAGQVPEDQMRCGFIAVIGAPNAGKSTLVNALVGAKVTIVSRKVQTTRIPVRGIVVEGTEPARFSRHPGHLPASTAARSRNGGGGLGRCTRRRHRRPAGRFLEGNHRGRGADSRPARRGAGAEVLVLNKVDRLADKSKLLTLTDELTKRVEFERVFMVSALTGSGLKDLKSYLVEVAPPGPWHYPPDELSDLTDRRLAAEITREKIYERLHEELPYSITVETTDWKTKRDGSVRIDQTIYVERESQRKIVLGKGGATVKQISMEARKELAEPPGHPVHLFLYVKVREDWAEDPERYREMGLEFPKE